MLTKRQNLVETIKGGNPDRFVKQYEFMDIIMEAPIYGFNCGPGMTVKDPWGVTIQWPEGQPGPFPVHDEEHIVLKDVTEWRDYVKWPSLDFPDEAWQAAVDHANAIDRNEVFAASFCAPGIFERLHYLMGMENALMAFYEEPEALQELIDYLTEYEIKFADVIIEKLKPDALFHHDDWGSAKSTFVSPAMFEEFIMPAYKKIYQHYKDKGIEIIVHHSDSFGETIVPSMIEMGMDIWQGCMSSNNIPEMIKKYGGQISFMGGLDNSFLDKEDWTPELVAQHVEKVCQEGGKHSYIPSLIMGGPGSVYPGVYEAVNDEIDRMSKEIFA